MWKILYFPHNEAYLWAGIDLSQGEPSRDRHKRQVFYLILLALSWLAHRMHWIFRKMTNGGSSSGDKSSEAHACMNQPYYWKHPNVKSHNQVTKGILSSSTVTNISLQSNEMQTAYYYSLLLATMSHRISDKISLSSLARVHRNA